MTRIAAVVAGGVFLLTLLGATRQGLQMRSIAVMAGALGWQ